MSYACILYTPTHSIPNKNFLGEGLRAFYTRENFYTLSCLEQQDCVWDNLFLIHGRREEFWPAESFPPTKDCTGSNLKIDFIL